EKEAVPLIKALRLKGIRLERDYGAKGIKAQMKRADKLGAKFVLILGDDELSSNSITVKNMENGEQEKNPVSMIEERLEALMKGKT
ncbi:MAG: His/Gly/Thr/Pro-type tRNA ligase C-terminal domain-containing protein, partial [Deltaproteobacteria bacterium]